MHHHSLKSQGGAALLTAMLTVTLVATFAASALWQQYRSIEVEKAERGRAQVSWLQTGSLDWARLILRVLGIADSKSDGDKTDNLTEQWAVPLEESRLSAFLAADQNNTGGMTVEESLDAFLSARITDAQSKLNINNLIENGTESAPDVAAFAKLFQQLDIPRTELNDLTRQLLDANYIPPPKPAVPDPKRNPVPPLMPQRVNQLTWLGVSAETLEKITPFVTLIDARTPVNLNTASAEVIFAVVPNLHLAEAKQAVIQRAKPFKSLTDASSVFPAFAGQLVDKNHSVSTNYFETWGRLRLENVVIEEQSLLRRDFTTKNVITKWRERAIKSSFEPSLQ